MTETQPRPHLWIPETEIENVEKKPQSRSKDYDLDHSSHGNKLSNGLVRIADLMRSAESTESIDSDLIAFKIILQDKENVVFQREFIESEGLTINAVKDDRRVIVSTSLDTFKTLQKRVQRYKEDGTKKKFQYIEAFEPFVGEDKCTASIERFVNRESQESAIDDTADVQIMLLPDMAAEARTKARHGIVDKIQKQRGVLHGTPYSLTDGTIVVRASLSASAIGNISEDSCVYWIGETSFFRSEPVNDSDITSLAQNMKLDPNVDVQSLPTVVVLDNGVTFPAGLDAIVPVHWQATGCVRNESFGNHGTPVAGNVAFRYIGQQIVNPHLTPRARIIDAQIDDSNMVPEDVMINRVREAVHAFSDTAKIFNFSYNVDHSIEGDEMSVIGYEFDLLANKYGVRFVLSAGNHALFKSQSSLRDVIEDDDSRLAPPGDAMLGITVGSVVGADHPQSLSVRNEIAPYSRRGPGLAGFFKPDLVAYGATNLKDGTVPPDVYSTCLLENGLCAKAGTSFTAPIVAGDLAQVLSALGHNDVGLAQALLYNGAVPCNDTVESTEASASMLYGRGLSSPENSMHSSDHRVSFIRAGTMNRLTKQRVKFPMPSVMANLQLKRGAKKVRVTVTCLAQPPVDRKHGSQYASAYISASIHMLNSKGSNVPANPPDSDNRNKWDTCYHFSREFSSLSSGNWEVWLELFTRWGVADDEEIPYWLVITVEDLTESVNLYTEIITESAGRFAPVRSASRVSIR